MWVFSCFCACERRERSAPAVQRPSSRRGEADDDGIGLGVAVSSVAELLERSDGDGQAPELRGCRLDDVRRRGSERDAYRVSPSSAVDGGPVVADGALILERQAERTEIGRQRRYAELAHSGSEEDQLAGPRQDHGLVQRRVKNGVHGGVYREIKRVAGLQQVRGQAGHVQVQPPLRGYTA